MSENGEEARLSALPAFEASTCLVWTCIMYFICTHYVEGNVTKFAPEKTQVGPFRAEGGAVGVPGGGGEHFFFFITLKPRVE